MKVGRLCVAVGLSGVLLTACGGPSESRTESTATADAYVSVADACSAYNKLLDVSPLDEATMTSEWFRKAGAFFAAMSDGLAEVARRSATTDEVIHQRLQDVASATAAAADLALKVAEDPSAANLQEFNVAGKAAGAALDVVSSVCGFSG